MSARAAIERGIRIHIVTQERPESESFIALLREKRALDPQNVTLRIIKDSDLLINFAVVDNKRYRYEKNHQKLEAVACMNDPSVSEALADLFRNLERASVSVDI